MHIITETSELARFCQAATAHPYVTVDTEFLRETTYWPKLCLVQMATPDEAVIVDPIGTDIDLAPMLELFANEDVVKVFHAAKQDVEIFVNLSGEAPKSLFDTQVAAAVCGFGDSISYDNMVRQITGAQVDKSSRFTNWSHRPLTEKQLTYALGDVTHLRDCYLHIVAELDKRDRWAWINDELKALMQPENYVVMPENAWKRMKMKVNRPRDFALLKMLAAWREEKAQKQNVPRGRVLKDEALFELSQQQPTNPKAFDRLRAFSNGFGRSSTAAELIKIVEAAKELDKSELPKIPRKPNGPSPKGAIGDLLRVLLKAVSEQEGVAPRIIATSDDIDSIVLSDQADVAALTGWRAEVFGEKALAIKHGKMALGATSEGIVPVKVDLAPEEID
ncbi:ribonuclease D [Maritalea myrionectae]|uniref:Ribonuclease D n=1 Tax=Maritalea myrionectae TaxID=454601 RepID=A0A2R4MF42_9HYPH|nr:ribonuclease D [Maritalea myrionectae]AVX04489.1 ribonuclease D [Maritalea myrionectae]